LLGFEALGILTWVLCAAGLCAVSSPAIAIEVVRLDGFRPGTVVIRNGERRLYYVLEDGQALRYRVAVGQRGKQWTGTAQITSKRDKPAWSPPAEVKRDRPHLPDVIPGGAPNNPMGVAALVLSLPEIAIHGTSASMRRSIGTAASYGCIRMLNEDILDLSARVRVGAPVVVIN
jgi:lipoprotein-anchoring transpeptidase ErfK/SrfK